MKIILTLVDDNINVREVETQELNKALTRREQLREYKELEEMKGSTVG